jgi:hypothetical protein
MQRHGKYNILGTTFCYIVGMVEILWRSLAQGFWIQQVFACFFLSFYFLGQWKDINSQACIVP